LNGSEKDLNVAPLFVCKQWVKTEEGVALFLTVVDSAAVDDFNSFELTSQTQLNRNCIAEI